MTNKNLNIEKAHEVLRIIGDGGFHDEGGVFWDVPLPDSKLYTPVELDPSWRPLGEPVFGRTSFTLVDGFSMDGLDAEGDYIHTAILNFAAARNPGGGFLSGSRAQEEELCRCSALYPSLLSQPLYYEANRAHPDTLYTNHTIFSQDVAFFRRSSNEPPSQPKFYSVITCPAPNLIGVEDESADFTLKLIEIWKERWRSVLLVAVDQGVTSLILGAWGCGAFRNNPQMVAEAFLEVWGELDIDGFFQNVVFTIPGSYDANSKKNLETFRTVLRGLWDSSPA